MKNVIRIEEAALFVLSVVVFSRTGYPWWLFPALLFVPDLGMAGYAVNAKIGAYVYNVVHHRALSITLYIVGLYVSSGILQLIGIILFAHSTLDRVFGYGLKYTDEFKHTHLS